MSIWSQQTKHPIDYLLLENGDRLLLEDYDPAEGASIILDQTGTDISDWNNQSKN